MKPTDFAYFLSKYLNGYLAGQQNFGANTIASYRDTFKLFLRFCVTEKGLRPERITFASFSKDLVVEFVHWLGITRQCCPATQNHRLAVIRSFFTYVQQEVPEQMFLCQSIGALSSKNSAGTMMNYLPFEGIRAILAAPDQNSRLGRRDLTMLALLYDTAARVQELVDLRVRDLRLTDPAGAHLLGKGGKWRFVQLMKPTVQLLREYLTENQLSTPNVLACPLFANRSGHKLTRAGVAYILKKYVCAAREKTPEYIIQAVTPHTFRHSKAMHLLQSGVDLIYIRDLLGHSDVKTTEIYARTDSEAKRKALESAYRNPIPNERPAWTDDREIMKLLQSLT